MLLGGIGYSNLFRISYFDIRIFSSDRHRKTLVAHVYSHDAAVPGGEGSPSRDDAALPHGGFLRAVRRRCATGGQGPWADSDQPGQDRSHGGVPASFAGASSAQAVASGA